MSDDVIERVRATLDTCDGETARRIARQLLGSSEYLDQHNPDGDEQFGRYPCTDDSYHRCSFGAQHDPGCKALGGDGDVSANGFERARSCEPDCSEGEPVPWCNCSGFDCPDCERVVELRGLVAGAAEKVTS